MAPEIDLMLLDISGRVAALLISMISGLALIQLRLSILGLFLPSIFRCHYSIRFTYLSAAIRMAAMMLDGARRLIFTSTAYMHDLARGTFLAVRAPSASALPFTLLGLDFRPLMLFYGISPITVYILAAKRHFFFLTTSSRARYL